ncbi:MAG: C40 family peptidase [Desulfocucumaceae bacterium]
MRPRYFLILLILLTIAAPAQCYADYTQAQTEALSGMVVPAAALPESRDVIVSRSESGMPDSQFIIKTARSLLGKKYSYGGSGPDNFDCSGFTSYVFKKAAIDLPHSAADQSQYGVPVNKDELAEGDLVFFSYYKGKGIQHVGIYIGNNEFIHASSSNSMAVVTSDLDSKYYLDNYRGATRLLR